jgi:hypothetical protein
VSRSDSDSVSWRLVKLAKAHRTLVGDPLAELSAPGGQPAPLARF